MILNNGYMSESHDVVTDDGYILTLHRIPGPKNSIKEEGRPAILLGHCALCSSAAFTVLGPKKGLGILYILWSIQIKK